MFCIQTGNTAVDLALNILTFIIATAILVKGSDLFIDSAAEIARSWGVSELMIGLTLVSIGTSLPELASSVYAAFQGQADFIIGNIVGSNVTNISLILGVGIIGMKEMPFNRKSLTRDGLIMLLVYLVCAGLFAVPLKIMQRPSLHGIDFRGGILLLVLGAGYLYVLFRQSPEDSGAETEKAAHSPVVDLILLLLGILMISTGSKGMVDPAVWGAQRLGIPMLVISSTIVAFGTSVPELAVTIAGVVKKHHDIAMGNILGSCIFNILLIFGVTACITPLNMDGSFLGLFNLAAMGVTGISLLAFMLPRKNLLTRVHGIALIMMYLLFMVFNTLAALK